MASRFDDVIVYGATHEEYLSNLKKLLARFATFEYAIPKEMQIRSHEVEYGRHVINSKGTPLSDPKKLKVLNFPKPMLHRHIGFYGLVNYFRDHVPDFSTRCNSKC
jgi:hypothetical protein